MSTPITVNELKRFFPNASKSTIKKADQTQAANRQPVAGLVRTERKHDLSRSLDQDPPEQKECSESPCRCIVQIVRYGRRSLDLDNLASAYKACRDLIAGQLGIDDNDPRIEWRYDQVKTNGATGTHVMITLK